MKKWIIGLIVAGIVLGGGITLATTQVHAQSSTPSSATTSQTPQSSTPATGLTDTQKQQLQDLAQKEKDSVQALTGTLTQAAQQLKDALIANLTDQEKLSQAQSQILSTEDQLSQIQTDYLLQAKAITGSAVLGGFGLSGGDRQGRQQDRHGQMNDRLSQLEQRIQQLEERMSKLDGQTATTTPMAPMEGRRDPTGTPSGTPPVSQPDLTNLIERWGLTGLSDSQLSQLKDLWTTTTSTTREFQQQMLSLEKDLRQAIAADPTDQTKITEVQSSLSSLRSQRLQTEINAALQAKDIVGVDNFAKIVDLFTSRFGFGMGKGMGMMGMEMNLGPRQGAQGPGPMNECPPDQETPSF